MRTPSSRFIATFAIAVMLAAGAAATQPDFVRDVRPILKEHCYSCHGPDKQQSGLRLDVKSEAFRGGDFYGASIVPGDASDSPLIQFVSRDDADLEMPPEGDRLSAAEVETLRQWVAGGAEWPDGVGQAEVKDEGDPWSFEPVRRPAVPANANGDWARNPIDRYVLARLEQQGIEPAPEADRVTWLRRASLDLTGLPPSPEQVAAFLDDRRRDAYERVVDRLLASPRYGERWAQHWLDVVRYADTHGFEVNTERPHAWPYRDYVIAALNNDTPYDRFVREQIVGDALGKDAATGFLVTASVLLPGQIGKDAASKRLARQDSLDEIVTNVGLTYLGMSIGCARCHHHKFDPISQRDYYAMQAMVAGVEYENRERQPRNPKARQRQAKRLRAELDRVQHELARYEPLANSGAERPPVNSRVNTDRFRPIQAKRVRFTVDATNKLEPCIDELEVFDRSGTNVAAVSAGATVSSSGNTTVADRHELRFIHDGRYGNSRSWMSDEKGAGWVIVEFPEPRTIERVVWGRDRKGKYADRLAVEYRIEAADALGQWHPVADSSDRGEYVPGNDEPVAFSTEGLSAEQTQRAKRLLEQKERLQAELAEVTEAALVFAGKFRKPDVIHLLRRGDPEQPQEQVAPAVPETLGRLTLPKDAPEQQRRRALADWLASPENPLTARVMANRLWQGHFGTGLVGTPNDFGHNGSKPSHPELLDWLASELIRSGWSIKQMHRSIVLSATYRQAARHNPAAAEKDARARLLWRYPSRRLEAEAIRDSILTVSGRLNKKMGGPGFNLFDKRGGLSGFQPVESFRGDGLRRMIYAHKVRREPDAVFGAFDCPDGGQSTGDRRESTTPIQALNLLNSRFTIEQSEAFAARVEAVAGEDLQQQIQRAYQLALNRAATREEVSAAKPVVAEHGLSTLCRVLFNSNEFLFLP